MEPNLLTRTTPRRQPSSRHGSSASLVSTSMKRRRPTVSTAASYSEDENDDDGVDEESCTCHRYDDRALHTPRSIRHTRRHRKVDDEEMGGGARCCFGFLMTLAQILLHGALGLVLYWVFMFHRAEGETWPFSWKEDAKKEFWMHPVLMIAGFIYFMGQSMLMYRSCRCCRRIWNKLLHTTFHLLAIPCIAMAFIAVYDSHVLNTVPDPQDPEKRLPKPIPDFYSLHSWMGFATMGLFALQFIVGFFSFLLLLCCESATASFRASLVPIHSTFGITTFVMAVATSCSGITEKAFFTLRNGLYGQWVKHVDLDFSDGAMTADQFQEALVINSLGGCLIALLFVVPILLLHPRFRTRPTSQVLTVTTHHHSNNHHQDRYA